MAQQQDATIYLTDQVQGHPNVKAISTEIMFSVAETNRKIESDWAFVRIGRFERKFSFSFTC